MCDNYVATQLTDKEVISSRRRIFLNINLFFSRKFTYLTVFSEISMFKSFNFSFVVESDKIKYYVV